MLQLPDLPLQRDSVITIQVPDSFRADYDVYGFPYSQEKYNYKLNDYVSELQLVPLETIPKCKIKHIFNLQTDSCFLFITDQSGNYGKDFHFYCFTREGKYVCTFSQYGYERNSYRGIPELSIDRKHKEVCLLDEYTDKMLFYDYSGRHLRTEKMDYSFFHIEFADTLRATTIYSLFEVNNSVSHYIPRLFLNKGKDLPYAKEFPTINRNNNDYWQNGYLYSFDNSIYYTHELTDTIWELKPNAADARFAFRYSHGSSLFNISETDTLTDMGFYARKGSKLHHSGSSSRNKFLLTKDFLYAVFTKPIKGTDSMGSLSMLLYNRHSGKMLAYMQGGFDEGIPHTTLAQHLFQGVFSSVFSDGTFIQVLNPDVIKTNVYGDDRFYTTMKKGELEFVKKLKMDDNPVLLLVRFKDF